MARLSTKWTRIASADRLQRSSHTLSVVGPAAFVFGGELQPRQAVDNQIDTINLSAPAESATATLPAPALAPSPRVGAASAVLGDRIYVFSGRGGLAMDAIDERGCLWAYSPSDGVWQLVEPSSSADGPAAVPAPRSYHAMASDGSSTLYLHAGCTAQGRLSDLWAFDLPTRTWRELAPAPEPARGGTSIAFCAGRIYRLGGFDGKTEQGGSLDVYDVGRGEWESVAFEAGSDGPAARSVAALVAVTVRGRDTLLSMFGERDPSALGHAGAGKMLGDVWAYDVQDRRWSQVDAEGDSPAPRGWFDADVLRSTEGDAVIVHGGLAEDNSRLGDVWKLTLG